MAKLLKLRRGTTSQHNTFTGAEGEVTIDTTKDTAVVHDGAQAGGRPLAREDMSNVSSASIASRLGADSIATTKIAGGALPTDVTVTNANVVSNAAIAGTKISPDFGSQNITTTGTTNLNGDLTLGGNRPRLNFYDANNNPDLAFINDSGMFQVFDQTNGVNRIQINSDGHVDVLNHLDVNNGLDVTGDINCTGSIDLEDSSVVKLGTDDDFQLSYDNGNNQALISMATGKRLKLKCDQLHINNAADNSNILLADDTGAVSLFHGTSEKFKTQSGGISVTGNISVSGTVDGRDVASDGSKLDGIESGATADQSASEILTLIKTVDGSGSGLDADTLDGVSSGSFLRSDTADTASGDITFTGGGGAVMINDGSDIRLQSNSNGWTGDYGAKLQHHSNYLYMQGGSSGHILRNPSGTNVVTVDTSGNLTAQGNVTAYSDARLKTNVNTINDALSIVGKLRGVSFDWKESGKPSIGVIAQEVEKVLPELVLTQQVLDPTGEKEVKSVDYGKIVGVLINAINELKAEVDELKGGK